MTSESSACLERVAPEVRRQLAGELAELASVPSPAENGGHAVCSGCWVRQLEVATLALAAGALVRTGTPVLVAHRLADSAERAIARRQAGSIVEISLDGGEHSAPIAPVPVTYRVVENGQLVERTILDPADAPPVRPDVFVDGRRGPAENVAAGIVDVLTRAGWLHRPVEAVPASSAPPVGQN